MVFCAVVRLSPPVLRLCFAAGGVGWKDLLVTQLGVGDDGAWLLCERRARLLFWLVLCALAPSFLRVAHTEATTGHELPL